MFCRYESAICFGIGFENIAPASFAITLGDGYIQKITISSGGQGYNSNGYLSFTGGGGSDANARYIIANSQNTLQPYSTNPNYKNENGRGFYKTINLNPDGNRIEDLREFDYTQNRNLPRLK